MGKCLKNKKVIEEKDDRPGPSNLNFISKEKVHVSVTYKTKNSLTIDYLREVLFLMKFKL